MPSETVKWVGLWLDKALNRRAHIAARAASAARTLKASIAVMHSSWGMRPQLICDLVRATVLPCADYGILFFLPLPPKTFTPLDKINKSVTRCITGSFWTAALVALEKEAAILPAQLRVEREALNTVAYYLTLPPSHTIRTLLHGAITGAPKLSKNASILHLVERILGIQWSHSVPARGQRIRPCSIPRVVGAAESQATFDSSLGMEPIFPIYAPPWADPLPVTTIIPEKGEAPNALSLALSDDRFKHTTWYTDGSLLDERAGGGAAVRVEGDRERERIVVPLGDGQVYDGEMGGLRLFFGLLVKKTVEILVRATASALQSGQANILCVVDSQAALQGITSTRPRSGQYRAMTYDRLVRMAQRLGPHLAILNLWTPAHVGTVGNEMADEAAKEATMMDTDPMTPISLTTTRRSILIQTLDEWDKRWKTATTGRALSEITKVPPKTEPIPLYTSSSMSRKTSSLISQLRTGPSPLNHYRHKAGFIASPACEACGAASETRANFILECPAWEPHRQPLHSACRKVDTFGPPARLPTSLRTKTS
ncbi:hypothetical protein B0H13DRAFT_2580657 [Mycena leptocephala]|nr:hypothetical protein B0H13DRAFT_2580657 [Mycena leptocephala]